MTDYSKESMRKELHTQLNDVVYHYMDVVEKVAQLNEFAADFEIKQDLDDCIQSSLNNYIEELNNSLTRQYAEGTSAVAEVSLHLIGSDRDDRINYPQRGELQRAASTLDIELALSSVESIIGLIEFNKIIEDVETTKKELAKTGMEQFVNTLIDFFRLQSRHTPPVWKRNRLYCETYPVNYMQNHDYLRELAKINAVSRRFTVETGEYFMDALYSLQTDVEEMRYEVPLERKTHGKGKSLEVVVFKSKIEYRFTVELVNAIVAFTMAHGSDSHIETVMPLLEGMQQVA